MIRRTVLKKSAVLAMALLILLLCVLPVSASAERQYVFDGGNWLTDAEESALEQEIRSTLGGLEIFLITAQKLPFGVERDNADGYLCATYSISRTDSNVVLLITRESDGYHYDLYTHGDATRQIGNKEVERILYHESVYDPIIEKDQLSEGLHGFLTVTEKAYDGLLWASVKKTVLISVGIGMILAALVAGSVINSYKKKLHSVAYPLNVYTKLDLLSSHDHFLTKHVTSVRVSSSSGNGGRGGGRGGHRGGV